MKQRAGSFARWTSPMKSPPKGVLKGMSQRFAVAGFIAASFALMVLGKAEPILVERARTTVTDLFAPVLEGITRPISVTAHAIENAELLLAAFEENKELRAENAKLLQWERVARAIEAENKSLKALLNFVPDDAQKYLTARVVGDFGGAFVRSVLINAGQDRNVEKGQAVLGASALVGRVAEAGARSSRVLLVTDINSRIPVIVAETRFR
ncbi:MAG: rod shape-determining protein MreC, partial [Pseudomonadota bacterium]